MYNENEAQAEPIKTDTPNYRRRATDHDVPNFLRNGGGEATVTAKRGVLNHPPSGASAPRTLTTTQALGIQGSIVEELANIADVLRSNLNSVSLPPNDAPTCAPDVPECSAQTYQIMNNNNRLSDILRHLHVTLNALNLE